MAFKTTSRWLGLVLAFVCLSTVVCFAQTVENKTQDTENQDGSSGLTTIFPHSETSWWWVSGQINIVFQAHPDFRALYSGPNSLSAEGEHATSRVLTLYTGFQVAKHTEILFDVESAGGRGISDALGLAGFTNVDVVRNPSLGSAPYIARLLVHHIFPLSKKDVDEERTPLSLLTKFPERRVEVRAGKMSLADFFDVNSIGSDSHLQFLNWTAVNDGAYDYAADTRGYTYAVIVEYQAPIWGVRFGEALMPKVANGPNLDANLFRARSENIEFEFRPDLLPERHTIVRLLSYVNHANMGNYQQAVDAFLAHATTQPDVIGTRQQGRIKYGFGFNGEQELTKTWRAVARVGWNEGQNESFAYTEVDQAFEIGADHRLDSWHRPTDKIGIAYISNAISRWHQLYLALGGDGFLLGDGRLTYGRENILEAYYTAHLWRGVYFSPELQWVTHPGYNKDRGPVIVPGLRLHLEF